MVGVVYNRSLEPKMRLTFRQRVGLSMPSLVLRVLLAVVFIWVGLGMVTQRVGVSGQDAARLANMGVIRPATASPPPAPEDGSVDGEAAGPDAAKVEPGLGGVVRGGEHRVGVGVAGLGGGMVSVAWQAEVDDGSGEKKAAPPEPAVVYTADDFPDEVRVRRMWEVALLIQDAAMPPDGADGSHARGIWPQALGEGQWPRWQAVAAASTALGAGLLLVMGLLTRLAALGLMAVTAGAMWLLELGPAVQSGETVLGFLPDYAAFDAQAWGPLVLGFALFMAALALLLGGPGRPSVDHALFRRRTVEDHDGL